MAFTTGNDVNILQTSDNAIVGAGAGNDKYILSAANVAANQKIEISDTLGTNTLQLMGGLTIASSKVAADTVQLTLSNGAVVTVLGASTFSYEIAGDPLSGVAGTVQTYSAFVTTTLGAASVPTGTTVVDGTANKVIAGGTTGGAGQAFSLTTATETKTLTAGNDTVDGSTVLDSVSGDTLIDASTTDNDVANLLVSGDSVLPASALNIETVNLTAKYGSATVNGANYIGVKTLTIDSAIGGGSATVTNATIASVKAANNIGTLSVTTADAIGTTSIDAGAATSVTANGNAKADTITVALAAGTNTLAINGNAGTDAYTLNLKGGTLALTGNANNETVNIVTSTGAQRVNVTTAIGTTTTAVSGDQNVILSGADTVFATRTVTNSLASGKTLTVEVTGAAGTADLSKVAASSFDLQGTGAVGVYTLANNANVKLNNTNALTFTAATGATTLNVDLAKATTGTLTNSTFTTVNATANTVDVTSLDAQLGASADLKITGTKAVSVIGASTAKSIDATGLTGVLTVTLDGAVDIAAITGGSGNDVLTSGTAAPLTFNANLAGGDDTFNLNQLLTAATKYTIDGGSGTDVISFGAAVDFSAATNKESIISGVEQFNLSTNTVTITQKQLFTNGNAITLNAGAGGKLIVTDDGTSSTVFDVSGLKFDVAGAATAAVTVTGSTSKANTITGSNASDSIVGGSLVDVIVGGTGSDSIKGAAGADVINVGTGVDQIQLTTSTAVAVGGVAVGGGDTGTFTAPATNTISTANFDVITGMAASDTFKLSSYSANAGAGADGLVADGAAVATTLVGLGTTDQTIYQVRGSYDSAAKTFVGSATGTDTLFVFDSDSDATDVLQEAVVLVGYVAASVTGIGGDAGLITLG